jgi:hypothetical protein
MPQKKPVTRVRDHRVMSLFLAKVHMRPLSSKYLEERNNKASTPETANYEQDYLCS